MNDHKTHRIPEHLTARARTLRREQTPIEAKLWRELRDSRLNSRKFRRQYVLGPYIADFYCAECRLVVELDGESHGYQEEYDRVRTAWMNDHGHRVIRFSNQEVGANLAGVLATIFAVCAESSRSPDPELSPPDPEP